MDSATYGLIEAGGTKFVLGLASADGTIHETARIPTTTPAETLGAVVDWFAGKAPLTAIGIATFGPVELDRASPQWGQILATPKEHWSGADLAGPLAARFGCPIAIDTDVSGAALAEQRWGAGRGHGTVLYFTIGTGIGGGAVLDGKTLRGLSHPEMGHMRLPRHPADDAADFRGVCRFHGDCLEGMASGPSVIARYGVSLSDLPASHEGHDVIAWYIAHAVNAMQAIFEPGRIVLGGGVMATPGLVERIVDQAEVLAAGYFRSQPRDIITLPGLGDNAGLTGALALALDVSLTA